MTSKPRIAVLFYGLARSAKYTAASLEENVLKPARAAGDTRVFAHLYEQTEINNPRSGEKGVLEPDQHKLLPIDELEMEPSAPDGAPPLYDELKPFGDAWGDDFRSLRNSLYQLHSLDRASLLAEPWQPDLWIFCRPDLRYHDSLAGPIATALAHDGDLAMVPYWQGWFGGLNDRFALLKGHGPGRAYGGRIHQARAYCERHQSGLHAEQLVRDVLAPYPLKKIGARASRVRFNGEQRGETFDHPIPDKIFRAITDNVKNTTLRRGLCLPVSLIQKLILGNRYKGIAK